VSWQKGLIAWRELEGRHPLPWRLGVTALLAGGLSLVLMQAGALPWPARGWRWPLLACLAVIALMVGRRVLWNDAQERLRAGWRVIGFALLAVWLDVAGIALGLPLHPSHIIGGDSRSVMGFSLSLLALLTLASVVSVRLLDRRPLRQLGIVPGPGFWGDLAFGLGLGALLMTLVFGVELSAGWVRIASFGWTRTPGEAFSMGLVRMTVAFLAVAFYEELANRGYLMRTVAQGFVGRRIPPARALVLAVLLSSVLFGLGHARNPHATLVSTLELVLGGVVLSLPYVLTGRLATSIGLHATWNLFQAVVYGFPSSGITSPVRALVLEQGGPAAWTGGAFGPEAGLLGLLADLLGGTLILLRERERRGTLALHAALVE
jgi:membrane protease YdiL (CAAX protease family)